MAEARNRRNTHFSSNIFPDSPTRDSTPTKASFTPSNPNYTYQPAPKGYQTQQSSVFASADPYSTGLGKPRGHTASEERRDVSRKQDSFEPKYPETSAWEKKSQDIYGITSQPKSTLEPLPHSNMTSKDNYFRKPSPDVEMSARNRKAVQMSSHVFGDQSYTLSESRITDADVRQTLSWIDARSESKKTVEVEVPRTITNKERLSNWQERREDEVKPRYNDCNYSDLFGRKFDHPKPSTNEPLIPNSVDWKDARYEEKRQQTAAQDAPVREPKAPERVYAIDPKQYKQHTLCTRQFEDLPKPQDFVVEALEISGISDERKLKKALEGYHVIHVEQDYDSITGKASDKAKVTLRSVGSTDEVRDKLKKAGFQCRSFVNSSTRKSKYNELSNCSFLDHRAESNGSRENISTEEISKRNLRSQTKVVGSETEYISTACPKEDRNSMHQWEATLSRVVKPLSDANFMKPTTAWERKQS
mmetsp:Transcript_34626/g.60881  ORF Transcript_34626/g.60881 Transcript_34626/m.60881 type:complete len:474 (+) Transcript_34626:121-1542(+)